MSELRDRIFSELHKYYIVSTCGKYYVTTSSYVGVVPTFWVAPIEDISSIIHNKKSISHDIKDLLNRFEDINNFPDCKVLMHNTDKPSINNGFKLVKLVSRSEDVDMCGIENLRNEVKRAELKQNITNLLNNEQTLPVNILQQIHRLLLDR